MAIRLTEEEQTRVEENLNLIHHLLKKYKWINKEDYDDYFQCGAHGLCLAAQRFNDLKGYEFSTFAATYIKGYIMLHYRDFAQGPIKLSRIAYDNKINLDYTYLDGLKNQNDGEVYSGYEFMFVGENEENNIITNLELWEVKKKLCDKENNLLELLIKNVPQREIMKVLNISQPEVSRRKNKLCAKLKLALEG